MSDLNDTLLWQIRSAKLPLPEQELVFHPKRKWRFDFAWKRYGLAVEVEGGTWINGRHVRPASFEADCVKYNEAAWLGWRVIRVTGKMINDGRALDVIERAIFRTERAQEVARVAP